MMKTQQVFVRAVSAGAKLGDGTPYYKAVDVLDLDDRSFRAFVIEMLKRGGLVYSITDEACEGEEVVLAERKGIE